METFWPLNGFSDPAETAGLYDAIAHRESCRSFSEVPSAAQWEALTASANTWALPGMRMVLGSCENDLFQPFFGLLMKFENVQRFATIIVRDDQPESLVNAGISGETFMLYATSLGLGGCWVAGTYKHGKVNLPLEKGEHICALIALGVPKAPPALPIRRKRKPLGEICSPRFSNAPSIFVDAAKAIQAAPSAVNLQPCRLDFEPEKTLILSVKSPRQRLDFGISICHAVFALKSTPVQYILSQDGRTARLTL